MHAKAQRPQPTQLLAPVSRAHQEGLQILIGQLQSTGQDTTLLSQLAESLPRLRAGLSATERQRIEELDSNETALLSTLTATQESINAFDSLLGDQSQPLATAVLVDSSTLRRMAAAAQLMAEAANDLALRANTRAGLLE
jgi:hypothetical protein